MNRDIMKYAAQSHEKLKKHAAYSIEPGRLKGPHRPIFYTRTEVAQCYIRGIRSHCRSIRRRL